ncbi:glycoside hydrolase domain-containing protein, partial [Planctomycetota bacterium]
PAEVPVYKEHGGSLQPVWIKVKVPANAKQGEYKGSLTIKAEGVKPVTVGINLTVCNWTLPDSKDYIPRMDVVQSPETLAMAYKVEMWSDEHMKLVERSLKLLGELGAKTLFITGVRRTHWGNEHAMVYWAKEAGTLVPKFDIAEKYLDAAVKHMGKIPAVIMYCWEPVSSMGHAGGTGGAGRTTDKPILYTLKKKGKLYKRTGPAWGTKEAKEFWQKFNTGITGVLKKRGLENSLMYGLIGDARPTKQAMDDITTGIKGAKWAVHSHHYCDKWQGYDIGMAIALWGIRVTQKDPSQQRGYGWQNPFWLMYYPREMSLQTTLVETRCKLENWMGASPVSLRAYPNAKGSWGLGRLGADFWKVITLGRGSLAGRYPESYWGQLNLNYCVPYMLGRGKKGAIPTVRYEAFRENMQEMVARIFIEQVILDKEKRAQIGEDLAKKCRAMLDKRIRMCMYARGEGQPWFISSGWADRNKQLFSIAAEVAKKLNK